MGYYIWWTNGNKQREYEINHRDFPSNVRYNILHHSDGNRMNDKTLKLFNICASGTWNVSIPERICGNTKLRP